MEDATCASMKKLVLSILEITDYFWMNIRSLSLNVDIKEIYIILTGGGNEAPTLGNSRDIDEDFHWI